MHDRSRRLNVIAIAFGIGLLGLGLTLLRLVPAVVPSPPTRDARSAAAAAAPTPRAASEDARPLRPVLRRPPDPPAVAASVAALPVTFPAPEKLRPEARAQLAQIGPDWHEMISYLVPLMASYEQCLADRPLQGRIYYYILWDVEDHVGVRPHVEGADNLPLEGNVTFDDLYAFYDCVDAYLADNPVVHLPHANVEAAWGLQATFPVGDAPIYKLMSKSN